MNALLAVTNCNEPDCYEILYVGESKIICTIGIYFAVGYTAGWT
jgi:hypothetical protein